MAAWKIFTGDAEEQKEMAMIRHDLAGRPRFGHAAKLASRDGTPTPGNSCSIGNKMSVYRPSRNARTGSVRAARQAGKKHAANEAMTSETDAMANGSGSCGLTL